MAPSSASKWFVRGVTSSLVLIAACSSTAKDPDAGTTPLDQDAGNASDGAAESDAPGGSDAGPIAPCPILEPGNPKHRQYGQESSTAIIRADEVWTSDNVYFVTSLFEVTSCTLTIEAGTRVCLAAGGGVAPTILVSGTGGSTGRVLINGTPDRPVIFDRSTPGDIYSGFSFLAGSEARFDNVRINGGGIGGLGVIRVAASNDKPTVLRNVHLESFFKTALSLQNPAGLSADSTLFVDSQQADAAAPIVDTSLAAAKSLTRTTAIIAPTISEATRVIRIVDHDVREDLTLHGDIGADYYVQSGDLNVRRTGDTTPIPTLTMEAGTRVRFGDGELAVGFVGAGNEGSLNVAGTASKPVVLTTSKDASARGQWNGVTLYAGALGPTTSLKNLRLENAGGPGGANIVNCRNPAGAIAGALKLRPIRTEPYAGPTLENIDIVHSGGDGVAFGCSPAGCLTSDYSAAIKGTDNAGTLLRPLACP